MRHTYEEINYKLRYNPVTGTFYWKHGKKAGKLAGWKGPKSVQIGVQSSLYYAHILAWLLVTGDWPAQDIDHRNGDPTDNRWENLRLCSKSQNSGNTRRHKDRINSLPKGVYQQKKLTDKRPYYSRIHIGGTAMYLGSYSSIQQAANAYAVASNKYFGEFSRQD